MSFCQDNVGVDIEREKGIIVEKERVEGEREKERGWGGKERGWERVWEGERERRKRGQQRERRN